MRIFNTLTRKLEDFEPLEKGHVRMYTCGPTVYDYAHIGNFRAYVFEDILRRQIKSIGWRVTQVMNLTDIDDKTIRGARARQVSLNDYTRTFIEAFFQDLAVLNIERAEHYPAATAHVAEMIALIARLFANGLAYRSDDGSVYFDVSKFTAYGRLANLDMSALRPGARVAQDEYEKENVADFALWKGWDESDGDVVWDSPWGRGRPGWHIECSAMSMKYLGPEFDLHTGGVDNIFPHHENEIAQSEGATGRPFVRYWMHCAHLMVDGRKMSKSLGNFYTLRDILGKGYSGREIRFVLLAGHYRQHLNFTFEALDAARASLARLDEFRNRLLEVGGSGGGKVQIPEWARIGGERFRSAMAEDLNLPEALGALYDMVRAGHRALDSGDRSPESVAGALQVLEEMDRVLGLRLGNEDQPGPAVLALVQRREEARKRKDWAEADKARRELSDMGWDVRDTPQGPKPKRRERPQGGGGRP